VRDGLRDDALRTDALRTDFRFVPRARLFAAAFGLRALPVWAMNDFMTDSTAASAAAVAAAVAALTSICCTRAAPDLAAPTIVRRVFCTKLRLAMDFLPKGARAFDYAHAYECGNACFRSALLRKHWQPDLSRKRKGRLEAACPEVSGLSVDHGSGTSSAGKFRESGSAT
jgi:hypothetical protein